MFSVDQIEVVRSRGGYQRVRFSCQCVTLGIHDINAGDAPGLEPLSKVVSAGFSTVSLLLFPL